MARAQAIRANDRIKAALERVLDAIEAAVIRDSDNMEHGEFSIDDWELDTLRSTIEEAVADRRKEAQDLQEAGADYKVAQ